MYNITNFINQKNSILLDHTLFAVGIASFLMGVFNPLKIASVAQLGRASDL